tara:strand:- start:84 stop:785 length:702 start_codon:yes stop_codon:yes gene_type:complete
MNEFLDLPDDPEEAFAEYCRRKLDELERSLEGSPSNQGWWSEREYVDQLLGFDDAHDLGVFTDLGDAPAADASFGSYFAKFRRRAQMSRQKFLIQQAQRIKSGVVEIVVLDEKSREAIRKLVEAIRQKLDHLELPANRRDVLFNRLNAFAAEVDRDRTRTEAFNSVAIELARTFRGAVDESNILDTVGRVSDFLGNAPEWRDFLPSWNEKPKLEAPQKKLSAPTDENDGEIPF